MTTIADILNIKRQSYLGIFQDVEQAGSVSEIRQICEEKGIVGPVTPFPFHHFSALQPLAEKIARLGGMSNCHGHYCRAYTADIMQAVYGGDVFHRPMTDKWHMTGELERSSTHDDITARILRAIFQGADAGTTYMCTNIDADNSSGLRALHAAQNVSLLFERNPASDPYSDIVFKFGPHPHEGFFTPDGKIDKRKLSYYEAGASMGHFCGGLPTRDGEIGSVRYREHIDIVFATATRYALNCGVHLDQSASCKEGETQWMLDYIKKQNMEGRVTGVHLVSLSRLSADERAEIIQQMKECSINLNVCPTAALSMKPPLEKTPTGNMLLNVCETIKAGVPTHLGVDNIQDIYCPYADANPLIQLWVAMETLRNYDTDIFAKFAVGVPYAPELLNRMTEGGPKRKKKVLEKAFKRIGLNGSPDMRVCAPT